MVQAILGSGGAIGTDLARALKKYTNDIRLVSRNPVVVNPTDSLIACDLSTREGVFKGVEGARVVYVTIGFPYSLKVWEAQWPPFIVNVLDACAEYHCKLVFFDNIYMYDKNHLANITEDTPINPSSKKGIVRMKVAEMILQAIRTNRVEALIARSADFYGPGIKNSVLVETVVKNIMKGKKANWLVSPNFKHSFTYTPDAAKATALLGNTPDAFGSVWHLPTDATPLTGTEWIAAIEKSAGKHTGTMVLSKTMITFLGWFIPFIGEFKEMSYQYDRDYFFNSAKFENKFRMKATPYSVGVDEMVRSFT